MPLKVLFLCPSLVGAGVERRICTLVEEIDPNRYDVRLGLLRAEGEFLDEVPSTQIVLAKKNNWLDTLLFPYQRLRNFSNVVQAIFQIRTLLAQTNPDIVVSFTLETTFPMYFALIGQSAKNIPWIISEDSNTAAATAETCKSALITSIVQSILGKVYRRASHITCVSNSIEESVRQIYRVIPSHLSIQHNPIDTVRVRKGAESNFKPYQEESDYILAIGRLVAIKQFHLLIEAFAEVKKSKNIKLVILGEGPERKSLWGRVTKSGLEKDVLFLGFVNNPWGYMPRAKMLVVASKLEGFGNVVGEAMAAGCPVVSTRCGGPEDIIQNKRNGLLVGQDCSEIADAIQLILNNPILTRTLVKNALEDVKRYNPSEISAEFSGLLEKIRAKNAG